MKILIVKLGALGDVVNTFPLVVGLKEKFHCEIHWLVAPLSYPLVDNHDCVDKTILFDKKAFKRSPFSVLRSIRRDTYDITFDLQRILKSGLLAMAAKSGRRLGFDKNRCKEMSWIFPFERIRPSDPERHMLDQYLEFGEHLHVTNNPIQWKIPQIAHSLSGLPKRYIVLNIGATKSANLWPPLNFARLAQAITDKWGLTCILTGGFEDQAYAKVIRDGSKTKVMDLTGKTNILQLVELLENAECVVSCDTGPMHLACALNTKVISLFGPSNPKRTGPYHGIVIRKDMACAPCNKKQCEHSNCMEAIKPSDVMMELKHILRS